MELVQLGGGGRPALALGYAAASAVAGLGAAAAGIAAGRRLTPEAR
jgi:fluoride ion exporter CrcB/FEX